MQEENISLLTPLVEFEEISLEEKVGHGSYGVVYKAIWRDNFVAVKEFEANAEQKTIETEVKQLSRVRHENIISLYGISIDQKSKYLIMEFAEGGSLHHFLHGKVKPYYSTSHAISWARQCAKGVAYLHAMKPKPMIHRDLKPLNLLLTNKGRHLKICDFGTVADKQTLMTNNKGSAAWMAPEVFESTKYTEKCDIFSWSIVLWEVLSREQPFKDIESPYTIMWKIHKGERPQLMRDCPKPIADLLTSCWAKIPDMRPPMHYVVSEMDELAACFTGADEPLEYEFKNQQIITPNSTDLADNYTLDFSSYHLTVNNASQTQTQTTPTNTSNNSNITDSSTPTNAIDNTEAASAQTNMLTASIAASARWDVLSEEVDNPTYSQQNYAVNNNPFVATPATTNETVLNGLTKHAGAVVAPLSIQVDPNAWELDNSRFYVPAAKTDNKEHLMVTEHNKNELPRPANDTETDEDYENDGTDQSLQEMLDPDLQPEQPIAGNAESQAIYQEHRRLGKEYLRVDTELYYAQDVKDKILKQINPTERRQKQELLKKMREKEELLDLYTNLKQQLEKLNVGQAMGNRPHYNNMDQSTASSTEPLPSELVADDGWVVVSPNHQNT